MHLTNVLHTNWAIRHILNTDLSLVIDELSWEYDIKELATRFYLRLDNIVLTVIIGDYEVPGRNPSPIKVADVLAFKIRQEYPEYCI